MDDWILVWILQRIPQERVTRLIFFCRVEVRVEKSRLSWAGDWEDKCREQLGQTSKEPLLKQQQFAPKEPPRSLPQELYEKKPSSWHCSGKQMTFLMWKLWRVFCGLFVVICLCLLTLTLLAPESMDGSKKWFVSFWDPAYFSSREGTCFPFLAEKRPRFSNSSRVQHRCRATLSKLKALTSQSCSTGIGVSVSFRFIGSSVAKGFLKSQAGDKRKKYNMSWW